jgi:peptidyl-prolyl cis-trans isomerase SurA
MIKRIFGPGLLLIISLTLTAQADDEVLFTVDGRPVTVGEFRYIYGKTNGEEADYSRESVLEYLDLYERFKLKVARARDMGLDTVVALQQELAGYRKQLADNYLIDKVVTDRLVRELYERQQRDIDFSHLLVKTGGEDTTAAYQRALAIGEELTAENFAAMAAERSDDSFSKERGGRIGFVSAPLPRGLHRLEDALYESRTGEVVGPVRSAAGYHYLIKHGSRPAYGEVEIAHILVRKQRAGGDAGASGAENRIAAARSALESGTPFEEVAATHSEDNDTKQRGGYIGFFGINRYNRVFEEAAFGLERDGQVSGIVESPAGYHILKRISRRGTDQPLETRRPLLEAAVKQDGRYTEATDALFRRLRDEYGTEPMEAYHDFVNRQDSTFFLVSNRFSDARRAAEPVLQIGDRTLTTADFSDYLSRNARRRASLQRRYAPREAAEVLFEDWTQEQVRAYAEDQLEEQFPEFRALMREYREGILLFEATKMEVWDRAGEDTTGLRAFFAANRDQYTYGPRARVVTIREPEALGVSRADYLKEHGMDRLLSELNVPAEDVQVDEYEVDRLPDGLEMQVNSTAVRGGEALVVTEILPPRQKELDEARGYVIADYQDELERRWVAELRKAYELKRNRNVVDKLIES